MGSRKTISHLSELKIWTLLLICTTYIPPQASDTISLPPLNLGNTTYLDGLAKPGSLFQVSSVYSSAEHFNNNDGDKLPGNNQIDVSVLLLHGAHLTKYQLIGAYVGTELIVPFVDIEPDTDIGPTTGNSGVGDIAFSPLLLQWNSHTLFGKPYFHRLNITFRLPTGRYNRQRQVNTGHNSYSFNPSYSATLSPSHKWSASMRIHYLWNSKNNDPKPLYNANHIQAGSAFHMNYSVSYQATKGLFLGLSGYYVNQLNNDRIDGRSVDDSQEEVFAIGPGLIYLHQGTRFKFNSYFESGAKNRPEGTRLLMSYTWFF